MVEQNPKKLIEATKSTNLVKESPNHEKGVFKKGHKKFGGKKKGKKNQKTIEKEIVEKEFKDRIFKNIYELLTAQMNIAKGTSYLYKIVTHRGVKGGEGRREHVLVEDPYEIKDFLDELEGESGVNPNADNEDFYYISTKQPENKALDSLINRVFGKPKESIELSPGDGVTMGIIFLPKREQDENKQLEEPIKAEIKKETNGLETPTKTNNSPTE